MTSRGLYQASGRPPAPERTGFDLEYARRAIAAIYLLLETPAPGSANELGVEIYQARRSGLFHAYWRDCHGGFQGGAWCATPAAAVESARLKLRDGAPRPSVQWVAWRRGCSAVRLMDACHGLEYVAGVHVPLGVPEWGKRLPGSPLRWQPLNAAAEWIAARSSGRLQQMPQDRVLTGGAVV